MAKLRPFPEGGVTKSCWAPPILKTSVARWPRGRLRPDGCVSVFIVDHLDEIEDMGASQYARGNPEDPLVKTENEAVAYASVAFSFPAEHANC